MRMPTESHVFYENGSCLRPNNTKDLTGSPGRFTRALGRVENELNNRKGTRLAHINEEKIIHLKHVFAAAKEHVNPPKGPLHTREFLQGQ